MLIIGRPRPPLSLWGAADKPAADRDEDFSGAKPLHRLPVALRVAGDAPASAEGLAAASLAFEPFAFEPAKTGFPPLRVTPSVAPLRRASNCWAAGEEAARASADLTGAPVDLEGARETAGLFEAAELGALAAGAGARAGAGAGAGAAAFWTGASAQAPRLAEDEAAGAAAAGAVPEEGAT